MGELNNVDARYWLDAILQCAFPAAADLIEKMQLDDRYKDVTFETLNRSDFLSSVKKAFPASIGIVPTTNLEQRVSQGVNSARPMPQDSK